MKPDPNKHQLNCMTKILVIVQVIVLLLEVAFAFSLTAKIKKTTVYSELSLVSWAKVKLTTTKNRAK